MSLTELNEDTPHYRGPNAAEYILQELNKPIYRDAFLEGLADGLKAKKRSWALLYTKILKLVGGEKDLAVFVITNLGAKDEHHAKRAIERDNVFSQMSKLEKVRLCVEYLKSVCAEDNEMNSELSPLFTLAVTENGNAERDKG